ncbi:hypothetical protein [Hyphomicrobium facile]|uniref:Cysteine rich repeat-containing protein n=1 Tax=Hyphomicrobium facile TaxID=51670 RepID=A0A1I7MTY8_9HYPH|nr:hypothetical protein [Hyphomicrobium facile]SFV25872.1 hypothetical protein SAMN04488557_0216 [Hyphomicrobium facile]
MSAQIHAKVFSQRSVALIALTIATALPIVWASAANAVSLRVKLACSRDYYALCSQYASDSPEVRQCMRAAGEKLSPRCINALIQAGEVSQEEVSHRAAQLR